MKGAGLIGGSSPRYRPWRDSVFELPERRGTYSDEVDPREDVRVNLRQPVKRILAEAWLPARQARERDAHGPRTGGGSLDRVGGMTRSARSGPGRD